MIIYTKHILGEFYEGIQRCILCGEIIHDYRNVLYSPNEDGTPIIEKGWVSGEFYSSNGYPIIMLTNKPLNVEIKNCI